MAYKKDQGRYARMTAFWGLFLLLAYGCLGGLVIQLRVWFPSEEYTEPLPLIGTVDLAKLLAIGTLVAGGLAIHHILNRPKTADLLIETEAELKKVTWPSAGETFTGTIAVLFTVGVMLGFLFVSDMFLSWLLPQLMSGVAI